MFDASSLVSTSSKRDLRWRDTSLTLIWVPTAGPVVSAFTMADKRDVFDRCGVDDLVLAVRPVRYPSHQDVMVVDDRAAAKLALAD